MFMSNEYDLNKSRAFLRPIDSDPFDGTLATSCAQGQEVAAA